MPAIEQVYEQVARFAEAHGARRVLLFGSRARGDNLPRSDIDLAVEGCPEYNELEEDLQERLWSLLQVDVVNLDAPLPDALRADILRDGKVLYEKV